MPSRRLHETIDLMLLGQKFGQVHKTLDLPSRWLGMKHRQVFHDELSAIMIGYALGGPRGALSALLHVWLDRYSQRA